MEILNLLYLVALCALSLYFGQRYGKSQIAVVNSQYSQLQGNDINQNEDYQNQTSMSSQMEKQKRDFERLTKELNDISQKERRLVGEIKQLRQRLDEKSQTELQVTDNQKKVDLLSDKEFDTLLDAASKDISSTQDINEDEFDKQLNEATQ